MRRLEEAAAGVAEVTLQGEPAGEAEPARHAQSDVRQTTDGVGHGVLGRRQAGAVRGPLGGQVREGAGRVVEQRPRAREQNLHLADPLLDVPPSGERRAERAGDAFAGVVAGGVQGSLADADVDRDQREPPAAQRKRLGLAAHRAALDDASVRHEHLVEPHVVAAAAALAQAVAPGGLDAQPARGGFDDRLRDVAVLRLDVGR